ncbi:TetR family transcriptional regulator [Curtobacterium sp. 'Ferrero']|uniref:TetR/AcrR family transcriptional regulator n=1 Tax=Curtobacterium sp. 'Ferrero' TaxID=2033654 RepID=UPI000BCC4C57|nr:TetR/AcrR family transcriptional regulator [Curtobacterium sp. 'Ferrero']PCN49569.1 TetR family transcriptional regulator [Curtobacterium sp. 'Ferrero']
MEPKAPTARALARETVHASILAAARARLTREGPAQLSLRAVARDVGLVSSAVYRYFPSRDDLLTALLVLDYDELGAAVEAAEGAVERDDHAGRWVATCRAIRSWAITHPGDFALLYGSPVPGYAAPADTIAPASRTTHVLLLVVADAWTAGRRGSRPAPTAAPGDLTSSIGDAAAYVRDRGFADDLPDELLLRILMAWTTVFGVLSFELFGHTVGSVRDADAYFDQVVLRLADDLGLLAGTGA